MTYGAIIRVYCGADEAITALTDHGVEELTDMLSEARLTTKAWHRTTSVGPVVERHGVVAGGEIHHRLQSICTQNLLVSVAKLVAW